MRIAVFPAQEDATFWYRSLWPLRTLADRGVATFQVFPYGKVPETWDFDRVIFQRTVTAWHREQWDHARAAGCKIIYDLDDDIPNLEPSNVAQLVLGHDPRLIAQHHRALYTTPHIEQVMPAYQHLIGRTTEEVVRMATENYNRLIYFVNHADLLTVSTRSLAKTYRGWGARRIRVFPNMESEREWRGITRAPLLNRVVLGWAGGLSHYFTDLKPIAEPVTRILKEFPQAHLHLIGVPEAKAFFEAAPPDRVFVEPWQSWEHYKELLAEFDVTLAPSFGNKKFAAGKSDIRLLQSWMLGIPGVASPLTYKESAHASRAAYVATTSDDWFDALWTLLQSGSLRREMGALGKNYVLEHRTIEGQIQLWISALEEIA